MDTPFTFAERLVQLLDYTGWSQAELCRRAGVSRSSMSHWISGRWSGKQDAVYDIAKAANVSEAWLMGHDVPMERTQQPTTDEGDRLLNEELNSYLDMLTPDEIDKVLAFVQGLLAARQE